MVYVIYKTDNAHSYGSRDLIGVVIDHNPIDLIKVKARDEGESLSEDDIYNLINIKQTQNYKGEGEFDYEEITENILL